MTQSNSRQPVPPRLRFGRGSHFGRLVLVAALAFVLPLAADELPDIKDGFTPPGLEPGSPAGSYVLSGFDTVNYFNGSLNFALPLLQVGGRGSAGFPVTLRIGADWDVDSEVFPPDTTVHYSFMYEGWSSSSNTLHPGVVAIRQVTDVSTCEQSGSTFPNHYESITRLTFRTPDGTEVELRDAETNGEKSVITTGCGETLQNGFNRGTVFRSSDGSAITFVATQDILDWVPGGITEAETFSSEGTVNAGTLYFPNGTRYEISGGNVTGITDRNGNEVDIQYDGSKRILEITDSIGRTIDFIRGTGVNYTTEIQFEGIGGVTRSIYIRRDNLSNLLLSGSVDTIDSLFGVTTGQGTFDPVVTSEVELPNQKRYEFKYTKYGDLAQIILPTGGKIEYVWAGFPGQGTGGFDSPAGGAQVIRAVTEKKTYSDGSTLTGKQSMTYSFLSSGSCPVGGSSGLEATKAEVLHKDGADNLLSKEIHYYCDKPGNESPGPEVTSLKWSAWKSGKEYKTEYFDKNGTTLLRTINQTYEQRNPAAQPVQVNEPVWWSSLASDQQPRVDTRLTENQTILDGGLSSKITYGYDAFNNQIDIHEFDFGASTPKRRAHLTYQTSSSYINTPVHLRRLVTQRLACDAGSGNCTTGSATAQSDFAYDGSSLHTATIIDSASLASAVQHDSNYGSSYTTRGNVTQITRKINASTNAVVNGEYDILGNLVKITDAESNIALFDFNDAGTGTGNRFALPTKIRRASGKTEQQTLAAYYDYRPGLMTSFFDQNGVETTYAYADVLDRLTEVVQASNKSVENTKTKFTYQDYDATVTPSPFVVTQRDQTAFQDSSLQTKVIFDGLGRQIRSELKEIGAACIATIQSYDGRGRAFKVTNPILESTCSSSSLTPTGSLTTTEYDGLDRVVAVTQADGSVLETAYAGNKTTVTDEAGKKRESFTDALGRLTQVTEDPDTEYVTTYEYNYLDNLTEVTQGGQTRTFAYDLLSRLTSAANPESGTTSYTYDENGNLLTKTDARGVTATFSYDGLNRARSASYSDGTPAVARCYDGRTYSGGCTGSTVSGKIGYLTAVGSNVSVTNYGSYDGLGRVLTSSQQTESQTYNFAYGYNRDGTLASMTYPSGRVVTYTYDDAGRPSSLAGAKPGDTPANYASSMTYAPHGAMGQLQLGNNVWETSAYNSRLQPSSMVTGTTQGGSNLLSLAFTYGTSSDNNGNVLSQTIVMPKQTSGTLTLTQAYGYDGVNRLQSAGETVTAGGSGGGAWSFNHGYDQFGNMWVSSTTGLAAHSATPRAVDQFGATTNRLTKAFDGSTLSNPYDEAGNLINHPYVGAMQYDAENRQKQFTSGSTTATYHYDGDGRRVKRVLGGQTTVYVYDAFGMLAAEYSTATPTETGGRRYRTTDHLGSTRLVTNSTGAVVSRHDYVPFGEELPASSSAGNRNLVFGFGVSPSERHKFTGKERDVESGLDYFGARYMSAVQGRFTSADPSNLSVDFWLPQTWNRYSYTLNNPTTYVDDNGLWPARIHERIIREAFPGLTEQQLAVLAYQSVAMDHTIQINGRDPQDPRVSFAHAMSDGTSGQTPDEARQLAEAFIRTNQQLARKRQADWIAAGNTGFAPGALVAFGNALHTITDGTSPAHSGYKPWYGLYNLRSVHHPAREFVIGRLGMHSAVSAARSAFRETFGEYSDFVAMGRRRVPEPPTPKPSRVQVKSKITYDLDFRDYDY